ncbi:hypothetical protein TcG_02808 [Trypanosoma cruzi]|nr:hypothetical protein BCY84_18935 [Trypanosoma cruzi cruzi]RNF21460.1 hypothetical protein TcG_02808 [Trypanosoma cruzi]
MTSEKLQRKSCSLFSFLHTALKNREKECGDKCGSCSCIHSDPIPIGFRRNSSLCSKESPERCISIEGPFSCCANTLTITDAKELSYRRTGVSGSFGCKRPDLLRMSFSKGLLPCGRQYSLESECSSTYNDGDAKPGMHEPPSIMTRSQRALLVETWLDDQTEVK